jgi:hypothetical protein
MSKKSDLRSQLQRLLAISTGLFLLLAVLSAILINDASYQLTLGHMAKDALASQGGSTVLAPASHYLFDLPLRMIVPVILGLSALGTGLAMTRLRASYDKDLKNGVRPFRWIYLAVTASLMVLVVALLSGITDLVVLKVLAGVIVVSKLLEWLSEKQNKGARNPQLFAFVLAIVLGALPWLLIGASAIGTSVFGLERFGWHVYALYAVVLGSFILLALNHIKYFRRVGQWKDYLYVERNFLAIDLAAKVAFAVILIVAFLRQF